MAVRVDSGAIAVQVGGAGAAFARAPVQADPDRRIVVLPTSLVVAIVTVAMTLVPALLLFWAWRRGLFSDLEAQSRVIFDERDWQVRRPWEAPEDQLARELTFGRTEPGPGEWGGAERRGRA